MSYFYTSPTSNIPSQPHPNAIRMTRTGSSSSSTSTTSTTSSISISSPPPYSSRPGSSSASFSSSYWASPSSTSSSAFSSYNRPSHSRHNSNGTSYLPTPFRSSLHHSSPSQSSTSMGPSSYFSDDELLSLSLESTHLNGPTSAPASAKREITTEEQVAAIRAQVEREREGLKPEAWWQQHQNQQQQVQALEKRSRVVRFGGESGRSSTGSGRQVSGGKRRSVVIKGSSRRD